MLVNTERPQLFSIATSCGKTFGDIAKATRERWTLYVGITDYISVFRFIHPQRTPDFNLRDGLTQGNSPARRVVHRGAEQIEVAASHPDNENNRLAAISLVVGDHEFRVIVSRFLGDDVERHGSRLIFVGN